MSFLKQISSLFIETFGAEQILRAIYFSTLPDITKLDQVPEKLTVETLSDYFGLTDEGKRHRKSPQKNTHLKLKLIKVYIYKLD